MVIIATTEFIFIASLVAYPTRQSIIQQDHHKYLVLTRERLSVFQVSCVPALLILTSKGEYTHMLHSQILYPFHAQQSHSRLRFGLQYLKYSFNTCNTSSA
jgi:hypothetical protein